MTGSFSDAEASSAAGPRAFGATVQGEHVGARLGNQDAFDAFVREDERVAIAVADGHGSATCIRSDLGARFAVAIALDAASELEGLEQLDGEREQVALRRRLVKAWRHRVLTHLAREPFSESELTENARDGSRENLRATLEHEPTLAYGTTLLLTIADATRIVFAQIGDGDTMVIGRDGFAENVFVKPATLMSHETYSLCQEDAWQYLRVRVQERDSNLLFVVAATDGYGNAFPEAEVARARAAAIELSDDDDESRELLEALGRAASAASLDDTTIAVLVPPTARQNGIGNRSRVADDAARAAPVSQRAKTPPTRARSSRHRMSFGLKIAGLFLAILAAAVLGARSRWPASDPRVRPTVSVESSASAPQTSALPRIVVPPSDPSSPQLNPGHVPRDWHQPSHSSAHKPTARSFERTPIAASAVSSPPSPTPTTAAPANAPTAKILATPQAASAASILPE